MLAVDGSSQPAVFRVGDNAYGFLGNPGIKLGMVEDLIMEFEEVPADAAERLDILRLRQPGIEDDLESPDFQGACRFGRLHLGCRNRRRDRLPLQNRLAPADKADRSDDQRTAGDDP